MGGRIAEENFMHHMTTGAGNDIERATDMARKMVCEWGMSELGPLSFGKKEEQIFLGREIAQHRDYSEETAIRIDEQVKKLVQGRLRYARARHHRGAFRRAGADRRGAARARNPGRRRSQDAHQRRNAARRDYHHAGTARRIGETPSRCSAPKADAACPGSRRRASAAGLTVIPRFPGLSVRYRRHSARFAPRISAARSRTCSARLATQT